MRYYSLILFFLVALFVFSGCAAARVIQVTEADKERSITMHVGDRLEIVLQGNPTTGYLWKIEPWDVDVIGQIGEAVYKADSNRMGSGGQYTFSFGAAQKGKTDLRWVYLRPFERKVVPAKSFEIHVIVSE